MDDVQKVDAGMRLSEDSGMVEYGVIVDGVFHPISAERTGDYQERQAAGKQEQQSQQQPTPESQ